MLKLKLPMLKLIPELMLRSRLLDDINEIQLTINSYSKGVYFMKNYFVLTDTWVPIKILFNEKDIQTYIKDNPTLIIDRDVEVFDEDGNYLESRKLDTYTGS